MTLVDCDHIGWNSSKIISRQLAWDVRSLQPKHHGSNPRGTPWNFRPNRGGVLKKWLSAYKSSNISETQQDRTKVTIEVEYMGFRLVAWLSGNALVSINEVTLRRARLVLGWVTVYERVNHLGM